MDRSRLRELHFIAHLADVPSILRHGILSHRRARRVEHVSVASSDVQERRRRKKVPTGRHYRLLHDYANLYLDARNAMLYSLLEDWEGWLTVLAVDPLVLDLPGVVVADRNAASGIARFSSVAEGGIEALDARVVFARSWKANDDLKQRRCAEVLVPGKGDPSWIRRACVPDRATERKLAQRLGHHELPIEVVPYLFFRSSDD